MGAFTRSSHGSKIKEKGFLKIKNDYDIYPDI